MLLSMDKNGNVFETDSTRSDGLGIGRRPGMGATGDVALTSPAKFAESERARVANEVSRQKVKEAQKKIAWDRARAHAIKARKEKEEMLQSQRDEQRMFNVGQDPLLLEAIVQGRGGMDYESSRSLSGFGYTHDGSDDGDRLAGFGTPSADFDMYNPVNAAPLVGQIVPTSEFDQPVDDGRTHSKSFARSKAAAKHSVAHPMSGLFDLNLSNVTSSLTQAASSYLQKAVSSVVGPSAEEVEAQRRAELAKIQAEAQAKALVQYEAQKAAAEAAQAIANQSLMSEGFITQYKAPLMIGGGLLAAALLYKVISK